MASSSIDVMVGATYDVSAVSGGYSLITAQILEGAGTVKGNTVVAAGGVLSPGDASAAIGTLSFNGNLTLNSGTVLDFDLGTPLQRPDLLLSPRWCSTASTSPISISTRRSASAKASIR